MVIFLCIYLITGLISMMVIRWRPGYIKGFKDGFDEGFATNLTAIAMREQLDEKSVELLYKASLFVAILLDIIDEIVIWPIRIFSRFY